MDKLKGAIDSKVGGKSSQPGSGIERSADNAANARKFSVSSFPLSTSRIPDQKN